LSPVTHDGQDFVFDTLFMSWLLFPVLGF